MSAPLPPHVATADEPIPPNLGRRHGRGTPDMRTVTPIEKMLAELANVADDDVEFVAAFIVFMEEIGCNLTAHYDRDGELGLSVGYPCDGQERHRNRWSYYLVEQLDKIDTRRALLQRILIAAGRCWDQRLANPRETTVAMRDFLRVGGRLMLTPQGELQEGGEVPRAFVDGGDDDAAECLRASRTYFGAAAAIARTGRSGARFECSESQPITAGSS